MDLKEKKPKEQGHWGKGRPAPQEDKELAIRMVANGSGFRQTGRILGYCHETIRRWVLKSAEELPSPYPEEKPVNAVEVDEMHLSIKGSKKKNSRSLVDLGSPMHRKPKNS